MLVSRRTALRAIVALTPVSLLAACSGRALVSQQPSPFALPATPVPAPSSGPSTTASSTRTTSAMTAAVSGGTETGAVPKSTGLSRPFAAVRARWQSTLIVSATEDASDPDVNAAIAAVSRAAQRTLDSLATTAGRTALWSDLPQAADNLSLIHI